MDDKPFPLAWTIVLRAFFGGLFAVPGLLLIGTGLGSPDIFGDSKFETQVHHPLAKHDEWKAEAKRLFGSDSKVLIGKYIAQKVLEDEESEIPDLVSQLSERIANLTWGGSCLMLELDD